MCVGGAHVCARCGLIAGVGSSKTVSACLLQARRLVLIRCFHPAIWLPEYLHSPLFMLKGFYYWKMRKRRPLKASRAEVKVQSQKFQVKRQSLTFVQVWDHKPTLPLQFCSIRHGCQKTTPVLMSSSARNPPPSPPARNECHGRFGPSACAKVYGWKSLLVLAPWQLEIGMVHPSFPPPPCSRSPNRMVTVEGKPLSGFFKGEPKIQITTP